MIQNDYTDEMLEEAKAYLRDRIRNQQSMSHRIEELLTLYAEYLLNALFSSIGGNVENDVELLVEDLIEQIWNDCVLLAEDEHDRKPLILAYISRDIEGDNLRGRIGERVRTFAAEVVAVCVAGRILGHNYETILSSVVGSLRDPWNNPILVAARTERDRGNITIPDDVDIDEHHYGKGVAVSSETALEWMTEHAIAEGWMHWLYLDKRERGAKGYFVERGSSYNCPLCDSMCGVFRDISDTEHLPPFHLSCCCFVVYSFVDRL